MTGRPDKAVCYVQHDGHLLVFTHLDVPLTVAGVQVPAGTVDAGERPEDAAVRELREETGLAGSVLRSLGSEEYDVRPTRDQIATRHFFELAVSNAHTEDRWVAGEFDPNGGGIPQRWECWWLPLEHSQVLVAGLGAKLGALVR
ncbi:NUDIX domain-containing protein [uncultured Agrococcus sp.]|uniref:NUDIX domain-containing protein n=1 Tax=uncultured Agrococcus sp. TaxID=382258 RepID=UPI0025D55D21|nr:NUDIX domain-containing protein [uncultured Agrococcus sp.]